MERRTLLSIFTVAPIAAVLAACGSDGAAEPPAVNDSLPPATDPTVTDPSSTEPDGGVTDQGPVSAILEFGYYGGFTTREVSFQMQPHVLVTSDGHVITPAPTPAIYPGPLLPAHSIQTITADGVERLIDAARAAGLLANVTYDSNVNVADASTATLRITVDGVTYVHEAYALGIGGLDDDIMSERGSTATSDRAALEQFADSLGDLSALVGADALGPAASYEPAAYQLIAQPAGDLSGYEIEPTVLDWPAESGVVLADSSECIEVDAAKVGDLLGSANQLTFFTDGGVEYQVIARPAYPGRSC